jgi:hypothetical protein
MKHLAILSVFILYLTGSAIAQELYNPLNRIVDAPKAKVMVLGVFHFDDAGLDDYKPAHQVDIHSEKRQAEILDLVNKLKDFRPTKIGLEFKNTAQARMDSLFNLYREGQFELPANEIYQLGFRLANQSGLQHVYGIDAPGESYPAISGLSHQKYQEKAIEYTKLGLAEKPNTIIWYPKYQELYEFEDSLKMVTPLEEYLLYLNSPPRTEIGHGPYLVDSFKYGIGRKDDFFGADMKTRWFNRNLRILQNIYRIIDSAEDRVLIIIGAGHLPILNHAIISSPELEWVEITTHLN